MNLTFDVVDAVHDTTWFERLILNILSYTIVLVPIAFMVLTVRWRLCPNCIQTSLLFRWFVYGYGQKFPQQQSDYDDYSGGENGHTAARSAAGQEAKYSMQPLIDVSPIGRGTSRSLASANSGSNKLASTSLSADRLPLFLCYFLGLQISYLTWGVLQEKIMTTKYHVPNHNLTRADLAQFKYTIDVSNGSAQSSVTIGHLASDSVVKSDGPGVEMSTVLMGPYREIVFHDSQFLVFINRLAAFVVAVIAMVTCARGRHELRDGRSDTRPQAPLYEYVYSSLSNILSSWCQYEALKYVNFPTQVLSKACKLIPVMLMSKLISRQRYTAFDYLCALGISCGVTIFLWTSHDDAATSASTNHKHHAVNASAVSTSLASGLTILGLYLAFDSFTSNWQSSLFKRYRVTQWQMMAASNFYSILLTLTSLVRLDQLEPGFKLLLLSPNLLFDCVLMSVTSATGQLFVYCTIKEFGPVVFTLIMTSRQLIAIILSWSIYNHHLTSGSFLGLAIIFCIAFMQASRKMRQVK
ncbi:Adenosine 3'-phospho 5'-phosphosulfate transporter 1, partial [Fragariocoptes setiger]